ncbi:MAG: aminodeoxychorismate synthase, component I [SAR86 cluster bacterium]|uniref:aminodeoxychorismate synthase n=1 Tax=SAR86 cluster bacterium TaxID=2030880 RepID=A0A2A4X0P7_9GAMM|nr:MAG: aminodeoxychorismate synthase, component I [SAR86 cluster bacterium]
MPFTNTRSLPYCADSELYMRTLNGLGMPAFLDSANNGNSNARVDILAAAPVAHLKVENGALSCSDNVAELIGSSTNSNEFLSYIRVLKDKFLPSHKKECSDQPQLELEHAGTAIGYLGYPTLIGKADFSIIDAFVGIYLWTIVLDHESRSCDLRMHPSCSATTMDQTLASIEQSLDRTAATEPATFALESPFANGTSFAEYRKAFTEIKSRIDSGDCYQVNLTQSFTARGRGEPLAAYLKLRRATTAPFSAYIDWNSGALLSLSPERFVSLKQGAVLTQPVKGTRPRGGSKDEDRRLARELASSEKDRAENLMIVDLLRNDLGRVCETGSIEVNQLFTIESFSNVHHMVSNVEGRLRTGKDALDLLSSCYPGGSITGAPKLAAMEIIQNVEHTARRVYCGTVFYLGADGSLDSNITIRSLLWKSGVLSCWAGGGIVADSDCEQEYQECFDKIDNIFSALQEIS